MTPAKRHGNVWRAVTEMREAGYDAEQALAAATSTAARACHLENETGRLAAGYAADVIVVAGDLADQLDTLNAPVAVIVRGQRATTTFADPTS
jgi:imidazolonepropionase-like amidohydrolase